MFAHSPLRLLLRGTTILPFAHSVLTRALVSFPLADIGEGIRDVEITKWLVKVGDYVNEFDPICEVRSDKATAEITSRYTGFIAKVYNPHEGSTQLVGSPLVDIQTTTDTDQQACGNTSEDSARQPYSSMEKEEKSPHTKDTKEMCLSPAVRFLVKEHQLDVSNLTGTGRHGRITKEDVIQFMGRASQTRARTPCEASTLRPAHSEGNPKPVQKTAPAAAACIPSSDRNTLAPQQRVIQPLRGIRRAMARTMTLAASVPTFSCSEEIDVSELLKLRRRLQPIAEKEMATARNQRIHLTLTPFFLKAVSLSMKHFPLINARYISEDEVHIMTRHDIGFALDSPDGLLVPKVRDCENRSILDIAAEVTALTTAGRDGKLRRETLIDGTVTLSNIGTIGATYTTPTLLHPEVAIGAVGRIQQLPRFDLEALKSRYEENSSSTVSMDCVRVAHVMHTSWTADHRVIDGATMVRFLKKFKSYLEQPALMVLDLR